jgi:hypothetical protein
MLKKINFDRNETVILNEANQFSLVVINDVSFILPKQDEEHKTIMVVSRVFNEQKRNDYLKLTRILGKS